MTHALTVDVEAHSVENCHIEQNMLHRYNGAQCTIYSVVSNFYERTYFNVALIESDSDGGAGEKKERKTEAGGWITSGTTRRRENCQGRKRKTGLGVVHNYRHL